MVKKIISTLILICMLVSLLPVGQAHADTTTNDPTPAVSIEVEKVNSWLSWLIDLITGHGYEDWFRDNNSCKDYNYSNSYFQIYKLKIKNISGSDIVLDGNNELILQFNNKSGKELGLKLYGFSSYQNINKSTRNYSFGSNSLGYKKISAGSTWELYGYTKWMNFSDLSYTIIKQPKANDVKVRLTEKNKNLGNPSDNYSVDRISSTLKLYNEGNTQLDLNKVRIHYYFKMDGDLAKVEPKAEKVEGKVYNYQADRSNPYEYVISKLPFAFINMGEYSNSKADTYVEIGFPSTNSNLSFYYSNYMYKFLRDYNDNWCGKYIKLDPNWFSDLLNYYSSGSDKKNHRWWWRWDSDYTKSYIDYKLSAKSTKGTSYVSIDLEIIKEILSGVTGDTSGLRKFYQANHYSFNNGSEIDWDKVTVYYDGKLIWGKEPGKELSAPQNLKAIAKNDGILLKWDEVAGAEGYQIFRKGPEDAEYLEVPVIITSNNYLDKLVTPGASYTYKVQAVSEDEEPGPESVPVNAVALVMKGNGLYAEYYNWKSVTDSTLKNFDYDQSSNFATNYVITNTDLAMARIDPKIDFTKDNLNQYYKWGATAPDPRVNQNYYTVIWNGYLVPKYSENYSIYTNTDDGVRFWLDYNNNGIFESSELYIDNWTKHSATENGAVISNLKANKKYKIKMEYFENEGDAVAQLMWSSSRQKKEVIPTSQLYLSDAVLVPEKPTNLSAVLVNDTSVQLSWDNVLNAESYKIYQVDKNGNTSEFVVQNDNKYLVTGLLFGEYTYYVSAMNESVESERSDPASIKIGLNAPLNIKSTLTENTVVINWDKVDGASGYRVKRVYNGVEIIMPDCEGNQFIDTNVSPGNVYSYTVTALKNGLEGGRSEAVAVTIPALAPTKLTAEPVMNSIKLTWTKGTGAQSYNILRSIEPKGVYTTIATNVTQNVYLDDTLNPSTDNKGKQYYYMVVSVYNGILSKNSNVASAIMYPFVETEMGLLRYNIITKPGSSATDFVLGSYIPVVMEFKLNNTTVNPTIKIDRELTAYGETNIDKKPFTASIVKLTGTKVYVDGKVKEGSYAISDDTQSLRINGSYNKDEIIKIEFAVKLSAKDEPLKNGIESYYNKYFDLKFYMIKDGINGTKDNTGDPLVLQFRVINPDKLN